MTHVADKGDSWADVPSVERARLRAKARSLLQDIGMTEADLGPGDPSLESLGCIKRPHELSPYRRDRIKALAKKRFRGGRS